MKHINTLLTLVMLLCMTAFSVSESQDKAKDPPTIFGCPLYPGFAWKDISGWTEQAAKNVKGELDKKVDLGDAGKWINQGGADIGGWVNQAAKDFKAEANKIDLTVPNEWIRSAATDIQNAIDNMGGNDIEKWLKQASKDIGLEAALQDLKAIKLEELPTEAWDYIQENPGQTVFYVVEGVAIIAPGVIYGPILGALGFGRGGVRAVTHASAMQKMFRGAVPAGNWFAHLTSAGTSATGYGAAALNGLTRVGSLLFGTMKIAMGRASNTTTARQEI